MLKKMLFVVSFILFSLYGTAQKDINNYKYILVPKKFDFLKGEDKYQLNSLTKFLFNKYGLEAYFGDDDLPEDLKENRCLALTSEVSDEKGGLFTTKLEIILKDCFGTTVMTSAVGETRTKEYKKAYHEAMRDAFQTFKNLDYTYTVNVNKVEEVSKVQEVPKEDKKTAKETEVKVEEPEKDDVDILTKSKEVENADILYAQAIEEGYQLVNKEPKVVMILLRTSADHIYMVKGKDAIVYKEKGLWIYYESDGETKATKGLIIKF